jgi:hypothetical protein
MHSQYAGFSLEAMRFRWTTNLVSLAHEFGIARFQIIPAPSNYHSKYQGGQTCRARREGMWLISGSICPVEGVLPRS